MFQSLNFSNIIKVRENTRDSTDLKIALDPNVTTRLQNDSSLRIMVFCAADNCLTQYTRCDITFPHQIELRANLEDVKANFRGLKGRPGTTRPVDITSFIRKKAGFPNQIVLTYALTQKVWLNGIFEVLFHFHCFNLLFPYGTICPLRTISDTVLRFRNFTLL